MSDDYGEKLEKRSKNVREQTRNISGETARERILTYIRSRGFRAREGRQDRFGVGKDQRELTYTQSGLPDHELAHALLTPVGSTLRDHQRRLGQVSGNGAMSEADSHAEEMAAFAMQPAIARRAGISASIGTHAQYRPDGYQQGKVRGNAALAAHDEGRLQVDGAGRVVPGNSVDAKINSRAMMKAESMDQDLPPQWLGHPITSPEHVQDLETRAAVNEFHSRMPRAEAEQKAHDDYVREQRERAAAHHLAGMRAAMATGNHEDAKKHWVLYDTHLKALGQQSVGMVPPEIEKRMMEEGQKPVYKFKAHGGDLFAFHKPSEDVAPPEGQPIQKSASDAQGEITRQAAAAHPAYDPLPEQQKQQMADAHGFTLSSHLEIGGSSANYRTHRDRDMRVHLSRSSSTCRVCRGEPIQKALPGQSAAVGDPAFDGGWNVFHEADHGTYRTTATLRRGAPSNVELYYARKRSLLPGRSGRFEPLGTFNSKQEAERARLAHHDQVAAGLIKSETKQCKWRLGERRCQRRVSGEYCHDHVDHWANKIKQKEPELAMTKNEAIDSARTLLKALKEMLEELKKNGDLSGLTPPPVPPAKPQLHGTVDGFMQGLKAIPKGTPERGKFITQHMNHAPFIAALQKHPQGAEIHKMLTAHMNSVGNAGFRAGATRVVAKQELAKGDVVDLSARRNARQTQEQDAKKNHARAAMNQIFDAFANDPGMQRATEIEQKKNQLKRGPQKFKTGDQVVCSHRHCDPKDCSYPWQGTVHALEPNIDPTEHHYTVQWNTKHGASEGLHPQSELAPASSPVGKSEARLAKGDVVKFPGNTSPGQDRGQRASVSYLRARAARPTNFPSGNDLRPFRAEAQDYSHLVPANHAQNGVKIVVGRDQATGTPTAHAVDGNSRLLASVHGVMKGRSGQKDFDFRHEVHDPNYADLTPWMEQALHEHRGAGG